MDKELTISIVTYNNEDVISILLNSLKESDSFNDVTVYVVDNASSDDTVKIIINNYPWVKLIKSEINLGFGKAHNLVINIINSKYHIIVNPDICIEKDTLSKSKQFLLENEDIVVVTPYINNIDGTQQFLPKKNPSMKYMIGGLFDKKIKICEEIRNEYTLKNKIINEPIDIEFCSGCFMITRTDALKKIGGFDNRYFLHFEDADLTRELRKIGRAVYNPFIKVTHKWQRDNKKINRSFWMALKSMVIYMKKWR